MNTRFIKEEASKATTFCFFVVLENPQSQRLPCVMPKQKAHTILQEGSLQCVVNALRDREANLEVLEESFSMLRQLLCF